MKIRKNAGLKALAEAAELRTRQLEKTWRAAREYREHCRMNDLARLRDAETSANDRALHLFDVEQLAEHIRRLADKGGK